MFQQPVKEQAAGARGTAVEAEGKFVEVVVELMRLHRALVSTEQPTFQQRGDSVYAGQRHMCGILGAEKDRFVADEAVLWQRLVTHEPSV